jgi:hypothetical protein
MRVPVLVALFSLTACDQLYLEATVPSLCQHLEGQRFAVPAEVRAKYALLPPEMQSGLEVGRTFDFDVSLQVPAELQSMQTRFSLTSVVVTAADGVTTFGFLDSAEVTLEAAGESGLEPHTFSYVRDTAEPTRVAWAGDDFDLSPYLRTGTLRYALSLTGRLPESDLLLDVDACAAASVKFNYLAQ